VTRYILSRADLYARLNEVDEMYGLEESAYCGYPPCGGCFSCLRAQVSYQFDNERMQANCFQAADFECAPYVIDAYELTHGYSQAFAPHHDHWRCFQAGEGVRRWPWIF
jgi:hypothetical protein